MYLMYVDESGDCGLSDSPTRYFILTGLITHELRWRTYLDELIKFRRSLRQNYGLLLREEIHSSALINNPGELKRISRQDRLAILRSFADLLGTMTDLNLINIVVDKSNKPPDYDVFTVAWSALIQRFENTISKRNFRGPANADDRGMILCDNTDDKKLLKLQRKMNQYNPVPHKSEFDPGFRNMPLKYIIEDPAFKDSAKSFFIQAVDVATYLLYQHLEPNLYMRKKSGQNYFNKLKPILCLVAASSDPEGIVRL